MINMSREQAAELLEKWVRYLYDTPIEERPDAVYLEALDVAIGVLRVETGDEGGPYIPDYIYRDMRKLANGGGCELCANANGCDSRGSTFQIIFCPDWEYCHLPQDDEKGDIALRQQLARITSDRDAAVKALKRFADKAESEDA